MKISEIRQQYPQYDGLSDKELADALHAKFYPDMDRADFYDRVGLSKKGVLAAAQKGIESLISSGQTALESITGSPEEAARRALARGTEMDARFADQVSLEKVKQAYRERGILPAAGEALSQVPAAIAEQASNIAATAASARAGQAAGAVFGPYGRLAGAVTGALAPSLIQQYGGNIERQAVEQLKANKPVEIDRTAAAATALPQAGLDVAGSLIPLGGRLVSKLTGIPAQALVGRTAEQAAKLADERLLTLLAKGTAVGAVAEIPTEIAQQMLERAQAGLSLSSPDALKEYGETAYQVGLLAPLGAVGRLSERGAARDQVIQEEQEKARQARADRVKAEQEALAKTQAEEAQKAADLEKERQSPEYAAKLGQEYETLLADYRKLRTELKRPGADATPEMQLDYKTRQAEVKEMHKRLTELTPEYQRTKAIRAQAEAQARLQGMSPEDFMLQQMGLEVTPVEKAPTRTTVDEMGRIIEEPVNKPAAATPEQTYAAQQIQAAKDFGALGRDDMVRFLLNDPEMAARLVQSRPRLPDMTRAESEAMLGALSLHLKERNKNIAAETSARGERLRGALQDRTPGAGLLGAMQEQPGVQAAQAERAVEDRRQGEVLPEVDALRRIAERPTSFVRDEDKLPLQVDALVDMLLQGGPAPAGRVVSGAASEPASRADTLRAQLAYATATDNRLRVNELKKQLADLNEPETERSFGNIELGQTSKEAGVEGNLSPDAIRANRITRLSGHQMNAYDRLADFVRRVREGNQEVSENRKQTLTNAAERLKETVVGMALNEIDARRSQAGMDTMSMEDQIKAIGQLGQTLDELIERGAGLFQKPVERPAQMRGTQIVSGALEPTMQPKGRRVFNNFDAAAKSLRAQLREDIDRLGGFVPQEATPRPERKVQRVEPPLRTQWQSASEREIGQQFVAAYDRAKSDEDYRALKNIEAKFKNLSDVAQDEALIQVRRVENGLPLEIRGKLKDELADLRAAGVSETGQNELFPGESEKAVTRTTPARFAKMLDSKRLAEIKAKLAEENRVLEFQAKRAATIEAKAQKAAAEAEAFQAKLLASKAKSPTQKAQEALSKLTGPGSKAVQAVELADQIVTHRNMVRMRLRTMIQQIEASHAKVRAQVDDIQKLLDFTNQQLVNMQVDSAKTGVPASMNDIAMWTQARANQEAELKKAQKTLDTVQKSLDAARATLDRVAEDHATDVLDNSIIREGEKAQRRIDKAKADLEKAQAEERAAARVLALEKEQRPEPEKTDQQKLEEFAAAANADIIRVYRDTSDPNVQAQVAAERKNIARAEVAHEAAQAAGDKEGMALALKQMEAAYDKTYEILNNAPLRRDTNLMASHVDAFDRAQTKTLEQTAKLFEEKAGVPPLKMKQRRTVASVRNVKAGRIETQVKKESVAAQEARVKQEEATGKYPARALEELAKARAEFADVQRQLDFIKTNPAAPRSEAKRRQDAARVAAKAKQEQLATKIKNLEKAQQQVVREAKVERKAEETLRKEGRAMLRKPGYLQDVVEASESPERLPQLAALKASGAPLAEPVDTEKSAAVVMAQISDTTTDPINKAVAERLKMLLGNTRVELVDDLKADNGEAALGTATSDGSLIELDSKAGMGETTVLHEGVHAATERVLSMPEDELTESQLNAKKELQAIYDAVKADEDFKHPELLTNLSEFAAESLTNPLLRGYMQQKKWTLKYMWDAFKSAILKLLGVNTPTNMSEAAIAAVDRLMTKVPRPTEAAFKLDTAPTVRLPRLASTELAGALDTANKLVAKQRTWSDKIKANATGLAFETQLVDRFAGFEKLSKMMDSLSGTQMMFYLRMYDQRMHFVQQSAENGALALVEKTRADGRKEYVIESEEGASLRSVAEILREATPLTGSVDNASRLFTMYLAAQRAERVGFEKLNFGQDVTRQELASAMKAIQADGKLADVFKRARDEYNSYNEGLVRFAQSTGALSKETADSLLSTKDYVPYYRERNGVVELMIGGEPPIRIGSIKEQPYLKDLIGGDTAILDFMTSSVQNTNMMVDMALRNLATKNAVFELVNMDLAKITTSVTSGPDVVKFRVDGDDRYAIIDTDRVGVPADILVKGMEGIPTQMPAILRLAAAPATLLRKAVTLSPLYAGRQLFRDSLAAPLLAGADFVPVTGALKEIGSAAGKTLERRGIVGGQVFTGTKDDITLIMRRIASGQGGWKDWVSKFETVSMEADALTRRAQYNSYIRQGMSEMEATLMSLESMNFNKRGASPSIHMLNSLIPFFNAQIQSLNVLYKALTGNMPFNDKLKIQQKLLTRGFMIAAGTLAYAAMMQDDEAYKNATPDQKYGNWFIRIPGVDEPVKLPIPFEIGYIFKALPEALYNSMETEHGGEEAVKALRQILLTTIPGGTSYGIPQALRPAIEAGLGKSFYTGRDILSAQEKTLLPEAQFRENTSELAKAFGKLTGTSPIILEELVRGYTGTMGLAFLQAVSAPFSTSSSPEQAVKRLSDMPVVGGLFQPNDAGAIINATYDRLNEFKEVKASVDKLLEKGEVAKARELIAERGNEYAMAEVAASFSNDMRQLSQYETAIRASNATPEEKRRQLDEVRRLKIKLAETVRAATDRTIPR